MAEELRWVITLKLGRLPTKKEMLEVFENYGPLASFADRISVCSAFGMIPDEMKQDLRILKGIRNDFAAHNFKPISFDDPEIAAECQKLKLWTDAKPDDNFTNENEKKFVGCSVIIMLALAHLAYLIIEQNKVFAAHADEIVRNAAIEWNDVQKKAGRQDAFMLDVPPAPSPDKSQSGTSPHPDPG